MLLKVLSLNYIIISQNTSLIFQLFYYITFREFFILALPDGLSLESEWQQASSGLLGSSRYSGRSQLCCLNSMVLIRSPIFISSNSISKPLGDRSKCANYKWYHSCSFATQIFLVLKQDPITYLSLDFLWFSLFGPPGRQRPVKDSFYYYYLLLEFFPSVLADGFSLEFEWQQVSSSVQNSSK